MQYGRTQRTSSRLRYWLCLSQAPTYGTRLHRLWRTKSPSETHCTGGTLRAGVHKDTRGAFGRWASLMARPPEV